MAASYAQSARGKSILTFGGYDYMLGSTRKDGSETWRCTDRDCEGRLHKKVVDKAEVIEQTKEHTKQLPSVTSVALHLGLSSLKDRAISHPGESTKDTIGHAMEGIKQLLIASMPSPTLLEECIAIWRKEAVGNTSTTPNTKENRPRAKPSSTRKRIKLNSTGGDAKTDGEADSPLRPLKTISTPKIKRARSISVRNNEDDDDDDDDLENLL